MVLVIFADFVEILLQLHFVQPPRFIHKINGRPAAGFHLFAQYLFAEVRISFEVDPAYCSFGAFVHGENHACGAALLIKRINAKLNADVSESAALIDIDDFLARLFQLLFVNRLVEFQFYFFADSLWLDLFGAVDFDFAHDCARLNRDGHF